MLEWCSFIYTWRAFSISTVYCSPHLLHEIRYTRFLVLQVMLWCCTGSFASVNLLCVTWIHHFKTAFAFLLVAAGVGCIGERGWQNLFAWSLMFLGRLLVGEGWLSFCLVEVWRIGRCFLERLVSSGWYVTTSCVLVVCLCVWSWRASLWDILDAFWICTSNVAT